MVKSLLFSNNDKERNLGFELLQAGFKASHFSSCYGCEFGARHRDSGWQPRYVRDWQEWYIPWLEMAIAVAEELGEASCRARTVLGEAFRGLWHFGVLEDKLADIVRRFADNGGWIEGWLGIRRTLQYDKGEMSPGSLQKIQSLEQMLRPKDLEGKIRARILARGSVADDLEDEEAVAEDASSGKYARRRKNAEVLGELVACEHELLISLLPDLCFGRGGSAYEFGRGIGRCYGDMVGLLRAVRNYVAVIDANNLNVIFIRGLVNGWNESNADAVSAFLDVVVEDDVWGKWFVDLQNQVELDEVAFERLLRALDLGICPTWQFYNLRLGRSTNPLSIAAIMTLVHKLASREDEGLHVALDILGMVVHGTDRKDTQYKVELGRALRSFLKDVVWAELTGGVDTQTSYNLEQVTEFAVESAGSAFDLEPLVRKMLSANIDDEYCVDSVLHISLIPFFKHYPYFSLDMVCVPDSEGLFQRAKNLIHNDYVDFREHAVDFITADSFIRWCNVDPEIRYQFAADVCQLFKKCGEDEASLEIAESTTSLLKATPDPVVFIQIFIRRIEPRSWSGSRAHVLESRLNVFDQLIEVSECCRDLLEREKGRFVEMIGAERAYEETHERRQNSSFE